ncbi:hypothetical protein Pd630_LPD12012 (plasmid) [Rhodococcus opacus PD630]|nr:hypothetical protein Pd630_LPD12012 [Rhodococcus opacus PD630]
MTIDVDTDSADGVMSPESATRRTQDGRNQAGSHGDRSRLLSSSNLVDGGGRDASITAL